MKQKKFGRTEKQSPRKVEIITQIEAAGKNTYFWG